MGLTRATINGTLNARELQFMVPTSNPDANTIVSRDGQANAEFNGLMINWIYMNTTLTNNYQIIAKQLYFNNIAPNGSEASAKISTHYLAVDESADFKTVSASAFTKTAINALINPTPFWMSRILNVSASQGDTNVELGLGTVNVNFQTEQTFYIQFGGISSVGVTTTIHVYVDNILVSTYEISDTTSGGSYKWTYQDTSDTKLSHFIEFLLDVGTSPSTTVDVQRVGLNWGI